MDNKELFVCYLQVTYKCNIHCDHCYVHDESKRESNTLTLENIRTIAQKLSQIPNIKPMIVFHGGECTLLGPEYFRQASDIFKEFFNEKDISFALQSNLIGIGKEWIPVIKDVFRGVIGSSFDPDIRKIGGSHERFKEKWIDTVRMLESNGVSVGVLVTLTNSLIQKGAEYLFEIFGSLGAKTFSLERFSNVCNDLIDKSFIVTDDEYYQYLRHVAKIYNKQIVKNKVSFYIRPLYGLYLNILMGIGAHCWSGDCLKRTFAISPDGFVSNCLHFVDDKKKLFGNILTDDIKKILYAPQRIQLIGVQRGFVCDCDFLHFCHGGCPHHFSAVTKNECKKFFKEAQKFARTNANLIVQIFGKK